MEMHKRIYLDFDSKIMERHWEAWSNRGKRMTKSYLHLEQLLTIWENMDFR